MQNRNQQVYSRFVDRLRKTDYQDLFTITRQEGILNVFLEESSIQKHLMLGHIKDRLTIYNPHNLYQTPQPRNHQSNLSPKQIEFNRLFKKTSKTLKTNLNVSEEIGFSREFTHYPMTQTNTRRQSISSLLEQDPSYQLYPSFRKKTIFRAEIISPSQIETSKTLQVLPVKRSKLKLPSRNTLNHIQMNFQPLRASRKFVLQHTMVHRMEFNESQLSLIRQLLMNMTGHQYKSYFSITLDQLKNYLVKRYPINMVDKLCEFLEFPTKMDLNQYVNLISSINIWASSDIYFLAFYMMDFNSDGVICPQDIFQLYKQKDNEAASRDFNTLAKVMAQKLKIQDKSYEKPVYPELYYVIQLTCSIYFRVSKKMKQQTVKTLAKKDTIYHKGFLGLNHKPEQRLKNSDDERLQKGPCLKRFNYIGEFQPTDLGSIFENIELCSLNLTSFQDIFSTQLPNYFHDILFFLALYKFPGVDYQYDVEQLLEISLK